MEAKYVFKRSPEIGLT